MKQADSFAALADIHGNSLALRAVIDHAKKRGVTRFVNLGDTFYGPLDPAGTWSILQDMDMPTVLGNQDRILLEGGPQWENAPSFAKTLDGIGTDGLAWLKHLPAITKPEPDVLLCHGTPKDDMTYLLEDITTGLPAIQPTEAIEQAIMPEALGCSLVLAGHSHHAGES